MKGRSKASKTRQDKDSTMSNPMYGIQLELPLFATVESVQPNNGMTLIDKLPICSQSIQMQKLSETSVQDLTSKGKCDSFNPKISRKAYGTVSLAA
jgi:hypothetical protein